MSGLPTQQLLKKTRTASMNQRSKKMTKTSLKRIRVIVSDPDATDSSSDDEDDDKETRVKQGKWYKCSSTGTKRFIKEVIMVETKPCVEVNKSLDEKRMRLKSKYPGVRQRESGRWAAEIRNPIQGIREWLGTYDTEEEAHLAHEKKRLEIQALIKTTRKKSANSEEEEEETLSSTHLSPCSVLHSSNSAPLVCTDAKVNKKERFNLQEKRNSSTNMASVDAMGLVFNDFLFMDGLKQEDFSMCNLGDLATSDSLLEMGKEDFSWLDEALDFTGL